MSDTLLWRKYPPDTNFQGKAVLNVGCGYTKLMDPNVTNLDAYDICKPDVQWDLNDTPLPFDDNSFDIILANHIMEHLPVESFWAVFEEFGRILKHNGRLEIYVPAPGTDAVMGFRDHMREVNQCSFYGTFNTFRAGGNAWADVHSKSNANWLKMVDRKIFMQKHRWLNIWPITHFWMWCFEHLRNTASEVGYIFRKVTPEEFAEDEKKYERRIQGIRSQNIVMFELREATVQRRNR